jgi:hypothetical protein
LNEPPQSEQKRRLPAVLPIHIQFGFDHRTILIGVHSIERG